MRMGGGGAVAKLLNNSVSSGGSPQILRLGAGGWIRDMDIVLSDNTMVCQTDTYGAYCYDPTAPNPGNAGGTGVWRQLVGTNTIPTGDPGATVNARFTFGALGVYAIRIAPSNTNIFYMVWVGYVYKTTNRGLTWANTNASFTPVTNTNCTPNATGGGSPGSGDATYGPKMAVDPNNSNVVYLGLLGVGPPWYTLDGGVTWSQAGTAGLPSPSGTYGYAFAYAPGSSTTLYCFVNGVGCYRSTNAGSNSTTWTKISGTGTTTTGLTSFRRMLVDSQGSAWVTDDSGSVTNNVWRFKSGSWTNFTISVNTSSTYHAIAEDPTVANGARIVLGDDFNILTQTGNAQSATPTWSGSNNSPGGIANIAATDIPYLQAAGTGGTLTSGYTLGNNVFDSTGLFWWASGVGVFTGNPPATFIGGNTWGTFNSVSAAIEQLVADKIISPPGGSLVTGNWDRAFLQLPIPHKYATTVFPLAFASSPGGQDLDWASSSPSTIVGVSAFGGIQVSGDGGGTWNTKANLPFTFVYDCIAAATPSNFVAMTMAFPLSVFYGTYNTSTGAVSLSLMFGELAPPTGSWVTVSGLLGTGSVSSLNGSYQTTSGGGTSNVNFTAATGFGSIAIGTAVTNGSTATSSPTLHFAATPAFITAGMSVFDITTSASIGTVQSTTGTTVVLGNNAASAVGSGDTLGFGQSGVATAGGDIVYTTDGATTWNSTDTYFNTHFGMAHNALTLGNNIGSPDKLVCADRVNFSGGGTFYVLTPYLSGAAKGGVYKTPDGGFTWTQQSLIDGANGIPSGMVTPSGLPTGYHPQLRSVNGKAGHLLCCGGPSNNGFHPYTAATNTMISTDGGITWFDLSSAVRECWNIDTGVTVGSYPRIWVWGWCNNYTDVNGSHVSGTFLPGIFYSDNQGFTWTKIAGQEMWGTLDLPMHLEADKTNAGQVYVARTGSGYDYFGI